MKSLVAAVLLLAACTKEPPPTVREPDSAASATTPVTTTPKSKCASDADCKTQSIYCVETPCSCVAAAASDPEPKCRGGISKCFAEPCMNKKAVCKDGACMLGGAM